MVNISGCYDLGVAAFKRGNYKFARFCFERVVGLDPDHDMAWLYLAVLQGNTDKGNTCLNKAISINNRNDFAWDLRHFYDNTPIAANVPGNTTVINIGNLYIDNRNPGPRVPREEIFYEGKLPFKVVYFSHSFLWLLVWGWNLGLLGTWLEQNRVRLCISSERILKLYGLYSREEQDVELYRVRDVVCRQTILQRLFGCGEITITTNDNGESSNMTFAIKRPQVLSEQLRHAVLEQRREMHTIHTD